MHEVKVKEMEGGKATGISVKWDNGQFCLVVADKGVLGCAIFNPEIFDEFSMTGAMAKGTVEKPLVEPEDLLPVRVIMVSKDAQKLGIKEGMTGQEVLKKLAG